MGSETKSTFSSRRWIAIVLCIVVANGFIVQSLQLSNKQFRLKGGIVAFEDAQLSVKDSQLSEPLHVADACDVFLRTLETINPAKWDRGLTTQRDCLLSAMPNFKRPKTTAAPEYEAPKTLLDTCCPPGTSGGVCQLAETRRDLRRLQTTAALDSTIRGEYENAINECVTATNALEAQFNSSSPPPHADHSGISCDMPHKSVPGDRDSCLCQITHARIQADGSIEATVANDDDKREMENRLKCTANAGATVRVKVGANDCVSNSPVSSVVYVSAPLANMDSLTRLSAVLSYSDVRDRFRYAVWQNIGHGRNEGFNLLVRALDDSPAFSHFRPRTTGSEATCVGVAATGISGWTQDLLRTGSALTWSRGRNILRSIRASMWRGVDELMPRELDFEVSRETQFGQQAFAPGRVSLIDHPFFNQGLEDLATGCAQLVNTKGHPCTFLFWDTDVDTHSQVLRLDTYRERIVAVRRTTLFVSTQSSTNLEELLPLEIGSTVVFPAPRDSSEALALHTYETVTRMLGLHLLVLPWNLDEKPQAQQVNRIPPMLVKAFQLRRDMAENSAPRRPYEFGTSHDTDILPWLPALEDIKQPLKPGPYRLRTVVRDSPKITVHVNSTAIKGDKLVPEVFKSFWVVKHPGHISADALAKLENVQRGLSIILKTPQPLGHTLENMVFPATYLAAAAVGLVPSFDGNITVYVCPKNEAPFFNQALLDAIQDLLPPGSTSRSCDKVPKTTKLEYAIAVDPWNEKQSLYPESRDYIRQYIASSRIGVWDQPMKETLPCRMLILSRGVNRKILDVQVFKQALEKRYGLPVDVVEFHANDNPKMHFNRVMRTYGLVVTTEGAGMANLFLLPRGAGVLYVIPHLYMLSNMPMMWHTTFAGSGVDSFRLVSTRDSMVGNPHTLNGSNAKRYKIAGKSRETNFRLSGKDEWPRIRVVLDGFARDNLAHCYP